MQFRLTARPDMRLASDMGFASEQLGCKTLLNHCPLRRTPRLDYLHFQPVMHVAGSWNPLGQLRWIDVRQLPSLKVRTLIRGSQSVILSDPDCLFCNANAAPYTILLTSKSDYTNASLECCVPLRIMACLQTRKSVSKLPFSINLDLMIGLFLSEMPSSVESEMEAS